MKHLSRVLVFWSCTALLLIAEDFWVKKPYTDWSEKDATKLLTNSPWSHDVELSSGPSVELAGGGGGRSRGSSTGDNPATVGQQSTGDDGPGGGGPGRGRPGSMGEMGGGRGGGGSMMIRVRWQSALPIRRAQVVAGLGHEKADSDQAKQFLGQTIPYYIVAIAGLPPNLTARMPDEALPELAKAATLVRKDKDPIQAESAQKVPGENGVIAFLFPKTSAITIEDKEVEFVGKLARFEIKRKFKLKDMMVGDKLEL